MKSLKHSLLILLLSAPILNFAGCKEDSCSPPPKPVSCCNPPKEQDPCDPAASYTGIDFTVGVGFSGLFTTLSYTEDHFLVSVTSDVGAPGVAVQLKLGATYGFYRHFFASLEGYGQYNSAKIKTLASSTLHNVVGSTSKSSMPWNLGLDVRLGYVYSSANSIYVFIGPDWGYFKYRLSTGYAPSDFSYHKWIIAPRFGAGAEQMLSDHFFMRESFDYAWYAKQSIAPVANPITSYSFKNNLATFLFSLGYLF